ncbi:MAG: D-alanyl-D-alanine carboxypeptidase [Blautia sp.]
MKKMKRIIAGIAVALCVSILGGQSVLAAAITTNAISGWPQGPQIVDETGVLMEADTGTILYDKGMDQRMFPASTTKVATALVAAENSPDLDARSLSQRPAHRRSLRTAPTSTLNWEKN